MTTTSNVTTLPTASPSKLFAAEIRVELARMGKSARWLSRKMGRNQTWISTRISPTATVDMTVDEVVEIAEALGIAAERLFLAVLPRLDSNQQPSDYPYAQVIDLDDYRIERAS